MGSSLVSEKREPFWWDHGNPTFGATKTNECLSKLHWCCLAWTNPAPLCDLTRKSQQFMFKQYFEPFSMKLKTSHQNVSPSNYFDQGRFGDQIQTFQEWSQLPTCCAQNKFRQPHPQRALNPYINHNLAWQISSSDREEILHTKRNLCTTHFCTWFFAAWLCLAVCEQLARCIRTSRCAWGGWKRVVETTGSTCCHLQHCAWYQGLYAPPYNKWNMKHGKITRTCWWKVL